MWFVILHTNPPEFLMKEQMGVLEARPFETADEAALAAEYSEAAMDHGFTLMDNEAQEFVQ